MNKVIVNRITDENYTQWIEKFVIKVLNNAHIKYNRLVIDDIESSKRVFVFVDGKEYTIRTWNYHVVKYDNNNIPCAENVRYTLYEVVEDNDGSHGEIVDEGCVMIKWVNNA